ncbi:MAG: glycosyltransferase family 4 protein [Bacteroidaceae bacterium]|nr:glycosyltransferase family 4 protein [Bacteroidaceae bacterium]
MKLVYLYSNFWIAGGADRVLIEKANYLADFYHYDVTIITDSQDGKDFFFPLSSNVKHIDLNINFTVQYEFNLIKRFFIYRSLMRRYKERLSKVLLEIKPDIVITTCGRELDFLEDLHDGSIKVGESHIAKDYIRNLHLLEKKGFLHNMVAKYWRGKMERAIEKLDEFVVLTPMDANSWSIVRSSKVIPNSIPFLPKEHSTCKNHKIISVGRLSEQKGYNRLIDAWALLANKYKDWALDLYGDGEEHDELVNHIKEKGVENSFIIHKPTKDIASKYSEASIYVMSSRFEGFGMVLIEALACGVPCISFNCPHGPSEIIENGVNGFLVENGNVKQLAESLEKLMIDEKERINMGKAASQSVERFSKDRVMRMWNDLFTSIIENKRK